MSRAGAKRPRRLNQLIVDMVAYTCHSPHLPGEISSAYHEYFAAPNYTKQPGTVTQTCSRIRVMLATSILAANATIPNN
jgi:hypothetical protein